MHVTSAESAEDGLAALSGARFDLVITDFRMKQETHMGILV
jgi:DNA-binding NtrC family response regulator